MEKELACITQQKWVDRKTIHKLLICLKSLAGSEFEGEVQGGSQGLGCEVQFNQLLAGTGDVETALGVEIELNLVGLGSHNEIVKGLTLRDGVADCRQGDSRSAKQIERSVEQEQNPQCDECYSEGS